MTKPIIVVKVPCKLLYVIQVKEFLIKCSTSWPYLISEFLVAYITIVASDWPRTLCFCLAYKYHCPSKILALYLKSSHREPCTCILEMHLAPCLPMVVDSCLTH